MTDLVTLLVYALAVARQIRLIREDDILRAPRTWWINRHAEGSLRYVFIACDWCISIWAAAWPAAAYLWWPHHPLPWYFAILFALSWLAVTARAVNRLLDAKIALYTPVSMPEKESTPM